MTVAVGWASLCSFARGLVARGSNSPRLRPTLRTLGVAASVTVLGAAPAQAASVECCLIEYEDPDSEVDPYYYLPGITVRSGPHDTVKVKIGRRTIEITNRVSPITGPCRRRSSHRVVCRMTKEWRDPTAERRVRIWGSPQADRLVVAPLPLGFRALVTLAGNAGNDTLVGGLAAGPLGRVQMFGDTGADRLLLSPSGPRVSDRLRAVGGDLLLGLWPSRAFAGRTLTLTATAFGDDVQERADGRMAAGRGVTSGRRWQLARLPMTPGGLSAMRSDAELEDIAVDILGAPRVSATVWLEPAENCWTRWAVARCGT